MVPPPSTPPPHKIAMIYTMRRHAPCPTCSCDDLMKTWAAQHLIPTPDTQVPMYEVTQEFYRAHPEMLLTQKAVTGRLRHLGYPIKSNPLARLTGHRLAS